MSDFHPSVALIEPEVDIRCDGFWETRGCQIEAIADSVAEVQSSLRHLSRLGIEATAGYNHEAIADASQSELQGYLDRIESAIANYRATRRRAEGLRAEATKLRRRLKGWLGLWNWFVRSFSDLPTPAARLEKLEKQRRRADTDADAEAGVAADIAVRLQSLLRAYCRSQAKVLNDRAECFRLSLTTLPPPRIAGWDDPRWADWPPTGSRGDRQHHPDPAPFLRAGDVVEDMNAALAELVAGKPRRWLSEEILPVRLPYLIPFIGCGQTVVVSCTSQTEEYGIELLQSLVLRIAVLLGRRAKFTLLDPSGLGRAFPVQRFLPTARHASRDITADLSEVLEDIRRINREVLVSEDGLHALEGPSADREPFEFVFAANFPRGFDRRAAEALFTVAESGPRTGRYVFIQATDDAPPAPEFDWRRLRNLTVLVPGDVGPRRTQVWTDHLPPEKLWRGLLERVTQASKVEHRIDWDDVAGLAEEDWWRERSGRSIATPIGFRGVDDKVDVWFGVNGKGQPCSHGLVAGMTGSGKSTLYHVLILGLAIRYSPDEIQFYLIDGKFGTEMEPYRRLPHARVVSLHSPSELARSVLQDLFREMERRNVIFQRHGVPDLPSYREKHPTGERLPRLLLLVDEYQLLFEDDRDGLASEWLRRLAQQGRSAGIHMLLGKQTFGAPGLLHQKEVFGNIQLRIAMKMNPEEVAALSEFGPVGRRLIRDCDMPGKFALNATGRDDDTVPGMAAKLDDDRRGRLIERLAERARREAKARGTRWPAPVVFDGSVAPPADDNAAFYQCLRDKPWESAQARSAFARRDESDGGLGLPAWEATDYPVALWVGRGLSVHGHTIVALRRAVAENLAIVCGPPEARAGCLTGMLLAAVALYRPTELSITVLHLGVSDDPVSRVAESLVRRVLKPLGFDVTIVRRAEGADNVIRDLADTLVSRSQAAPSHLVVVVDPDRHRGLCKPADGTPRSAGLDTFRRLFVEGPPVGIHVAVITSGVRALLQVVSDRQDLMYFNHRVATQVSEDDSLVMFRSRRGAQLQADGPVVPLALYANLQANSAMRFKPYSLHREPADRRTAPAGRSPAHISQPPEDEFVEGLQVWCQVRRSAAGG